MSTRLPLKSWTFIFFIRFILYGCAFSSIVPCRGDFLVFPHHHTRIPVANNFDWSKRVRRGDSFGNCLPAAPNLHPSSIHNLLKMVSFATVEALNTHLATRSYVTGYSLSADDKTALADLKSFPSAKSTPHSYRWALHICALTGQRWWSLMHTCLNIACLDWRY